MTITYVPPGSQIPHVPRQQAIRGPLWGTSARRGRLLVVGGISALLLVIAAVNVARPAPAPSSVFIPSEVAPPLTARGVVQPIARASIATLTGGVVEQLPIQIGQTVEAKQMVATVSRTGEIEYLLAPWRGTVTGINVQVGDSALPGTTLVTLGDLSRYQIESTDVDEYLIAEIYPGQPVRLTIDALDRLQLYGVVQSLALQQQPAVSGGSNYPTVIRLDGSNPSLRPGMTVRITFLRGQE